MEKRSGMRSGRRARVSLVTSLAVFLCVSVVGIAPADATGTADVDESQLVNMIRQSQLVANAQLITPNAPQRTEVAKTRECRPVSARFVRDEASRLPGVNARGLRLQAQGLYFVETDVTIRRRSFTRAGSEATLTFNQLDTYRTAETVASGSDLTSTSEESHRRAKFLLQGGQWVLDAIVLEDDSPRARPLNVPDPSASPLPKNPQPASPLAPSSASTTGLADTPNGISRDTIVNYALTYAHNYNGAYRDMNGILGTGGGDCTNFVSQALHAAGWSKVNGPENAGTSWFYSHQGIDSWSHTWSVANNFYYFGRSYTTRLKNIDYHSVWMGDIVIVDWNPGGNGLLDHAMIATGRIAGKTGWTSLLFTYHSTNRKNWPITEIAQDSPGARYLPMRVQ